MARAVSRSRIRAEQQALPDWLGGKLAQGLSSTAEFLLPQGAIEATIDGKPIKGPGADHAWASSPPRSIPG